MAGTFTLLGAAEIQEAGALKTNSTRLLIVVLVAAGALVLYLLIDAFAVWRQRRFLKSFYAKQEKAEAQPPVTTIPASPKRKV